MGLQQVVWEWDYNRWSVSGDTVVWEWDYNRWSGSGDTVVWEWDYNRWSGSGDTVVWELSGFCKTHEPGEHFWFHHSNVGRVGATVH